ncbi:MAG: hypothetical protein WAN20_06420, partial [Pseudonocardiaceae bacterium]
NQWTRLGADIDYKTSSRRQYPARQTSLGKSGRNDRSSSELLAGQLWMHMDVSAKPNESVH